MKKMLLLLSALIVAPAMAEDAAPLIQKSAAAQTALASETGVVIQLKGAAKSTSALVADLQKEAVYKDAACSASAAKRPAKVAKITCAKADGALMDFLSKNAQAVHWSISAAPRMRLMSTTTGGCAVGCVPTSCNGVAGCFKKGCIACAPM